MHREGDAVVDFPIAADALYALPEHALATSASRGAFVGKIELFSILFRKMEVLGRVFRLEPM